MCRQVFRSHMCIGIFIRLVCNVCPECPIMNCRNRYSLSLFLVHEVGVMGYTGSSHE